MNIGRSVKLCRTSRGLSQAELATKAGISVSYLSLIEQGKRDPTLSTLQSVAAALEVPIGLIAFVGSDANELIGFPQDLKEKLASAVMGILNASFK